MFFFVPGNARWSTLQSKAKLPEIGKEVDQAMDAIEKDNPSLRDVLPKVYARGNLDPTSLGSLIDLVGNIALGDAHNMGQLINRRTREFSEEDIATISGTYHAWRTPPDVIPAKAEIHEYQDIKGFCNSAPIKRVRELDYVLTPGRYVGLPDDVDDFDFNERVSKLKAEFEGQLFEGQLKEEARLNVLIIENLAKVKY